MVIDGIYDEESLKEKGGRKSAVKILTEMKKCGSDLEAFEKLYADDVLTVKLKSDNEFDMLHDMYLIGYYKGMTAEKNKNRKKKISS